MYGNHMINMWAEFFPLLRGRTGVEDLTRSVPVVLRFYRGNIRVLVYRTKAQCTLSGNMLKVGTRIIIVPYANIGKLVTSITIAFNYPLLERVESILPGIDDLELLSRGTITLTPTVGQLLSIYSDIEKQEDKT